MRPCADVGPAGPVATALYCVL